MPEPKPTLGYPTRTAAALALSAQGMRCSEIARKIGGTGEGISGLLRVKSRRTIHFPRDVLDALEPDARRRGLSSQQLAVKLLSTLVDEKLVDAILDDGLIA